MACPAHRRATPRRRRATVPSRRRPGAGQATVELALGLPVIVLGVLLVLQLALVGRDLVLVAHAAREAARAASVAPDPAAARRAAEDSSSTLDPRRLEVRLSAQPRRVHVELRYRAVTGLPIVGALVPDPWVSSSATMAREEMAR